MDDKSEAKTPQLSSGGWLQYRSQAPPPIISGSTWAHTPYFDIFWENAAMHGSFQFKNKFLSVHYAQFSNQET